MLLAHGCTAQAADALGAIAGCGPLLARQAKHPDVQPVLPTRLAHIAVGYPSQPNKPQPPPKHAPWRPPARPGSRSRRTAPSPAAPRGRCCCGGAQSCREAGGHGQPSGEPISPGVRAEGSGWRHDHASGCGAVAGRGAGPGGCWRSVALRSRFVRGMCGWLGLRRAHWPSSCQLPTQTGVVPRGSRATSHCSPPQPPHRSLGLSACTEMGRMAPQRVMPCRAWLPSSEEPAGATEGGVLLPRNCGGGGSGGSGGRARRAVAPRRPLVIWMARPHRRDPRRNAAPQLGGSRLYTTTAPCQ